MCFSAISLNHDDPQCFSGAKQHKWVKDKFTHKSYTYISKLRVASDEQNQ